MRGLMMDIPMSIPALMQYAAVNHGEAEIVSRTVEGPIHRYTYRDAYARMQQLAHALKRLGVGDGDRVGTIAWNGYRHFELYYAVPGIGAVCHTINPRLSPDQIGYIINHAADKVIFLDATFVPMIEAMSDKLESVATYVIMTDAAHMPETRRLRALCYETLIADCPDRFDWPRLDETTASSLCYTSGTTGNPKGALFSHRSTVLHSYAACLPDNFGLSSRDTVLPVVPMFHVNAWGIAYACPLVGARMVLPGPKSDGASIYELLAAEKVTFAAGVPTVWFMLIEYLRSSGKTLPHLERVTIGGAAVPRTMIAAFEEDYGVEVRQGWGMTEMSPGGTMGSLKGSQANLDREARYHYKMSLGRAICGVEMRAIDAEGRELPRDGQAIGELCVRGPWILSQYYNDDAATKAAMDAEGWFRTGDVVTIDADGFVRIVDRSKDVIKSGGEWISSIDIENVAVGHPDVAEAGVIGLPHPKWGQRPLLVIVPKSGRTPSRDQILAYLRNHMWKFAVPDDVVFLDQLPHTATGKVLKTKLREMFKDHRLPTA